MRKRYKTVLLRFTPEELTALDQKVSRTNLSRESFCRGVLRNAQIKEAPPADFPLLIRELRGIASRLDDALSLHDMPAIRSVAESCHRTEKLLWDTFTSEVV